jgi:RNA polymerase sigma-70 factor, ECF subfamily
MRRQLLVTGTKTMTTYIATLSTSATQQPHVAALQLSASAQSAADFDLMRRVAARDEEAMRVLFARYNVIAYRFALRLTGDKTLAEDLVSAVFMDVWRNAACFQGRSQVSTWILGMTRFKVLSALRRRKDDQLDQADAERLRDLADDPETAVQKHDHLAILRKCMSRLSREHREIIDLVYFHEKSIEQVAQIVGAPCNTVKTRMFYARKRLRELLRQSGLHNAHH